jgi:DNA-binding MarR family transcriptional regulator
MTICCQYSGIGGGMLKAHEPKRRATVAAATSELLLELTYTFFRNRAESDRITGELGQSSGRFGLLRTLVREGPSTVARVARSRPVARQGVQRMADELEAEGLVEYLDNPEHQRSKLLRATARGEEIFREMARRQRSHAAALGAGLSLRDLHTATRVLRSLRERLARAQA